MNTLNRFNETTSEQQFNSITRAITDNSSNALFLLDAAGVCTFLNPTAEMIFGYTLAELQGKPLHDYIHHTHPDGSPFPFEKCPIGRSVFSLQNLKEYEDVFLDKHGKFIPIKCSAKPLSNGGGELTGILLEVRDIRSEKHAEKLLRASEERYREIATNLENLVHQKIHELKNTNEDLQKFAHVASHDLKEPVRKIRYFLNRLGDSALARLTPEERLYFSKIERSADRLNMMIEGVLQYSMTSGMNQKSEHVDFNRCF